MKMKYVLMAFASMFMVACSDENEVVPSSVEDGAYKIVINLSSLAGDAQTSRTGSDIPDIPDIPASGFGDTYNNSSVFIHAVEDENGSEIGSIEIPVPGSSVEFTVNTEGNIVTISSSSSNSSLKMGKNDKIYFSSIAAENWKATRASWQDFTPISHSAAFTNGESTKSELYRSPAGAEESYTINQLIELDGGTLTMYRKCSAYSLAVMFSDLKNGVEDDSSNDMTYTFTERDWKSEFTGDVAYMYGKGYVGGFFPEVYNVYSGKFSWNQNTDGETPKAGYYVTNNQKYTQLAELSTRQIVDNQIHEYIGCGFQSEDYIRTPVVESAEGDAEGEMSVYVLFKPSATEVTDTDLEGDFNKEDDSVRMVEVTLDGMTPTMNVVSAITLVFDYRRLKDVFNNSESVYLTRTTEGGIPIIPMEPDVIIYQ